MCGISGFVSFGKGNVSVLKDMTNVIRHRGPDDEGFAFFSESLTHLCWGADTPRNVLESKFPFTPQKDIQTTQELEFQVGLGHRRLSILDLSAAGHQPMCTQDQNFWIVYNGEVYNHLELRMELEKLGYRFCSHSDTEVILAAFQQWGTKSFDRLQGMFAFLIYDKKNKNIIAVRDRFGIKPLYYRVSEHGIAFASEIKQFTCTKDWSAHLNGQRAYDFLNWSLTDHTEETLFEGVFQLKGGQYLELSIDQYPTLQPGRPLPVKTWYTLQAQPFSGTFDEAATGLRTRLQDSVRFHLRADVPVGSCLSGGLDSTAITCLMNQILIQQGGGHLQKTFSACSQIQKFDERHYIDVVVDSAKLDSHYVYPESAGLFADCQKLIWHQDEPFGSSSIFAQWHVFKLAAENDVKVMLDGQGADEQLAGYHNFFGPYLTGLLKQGNLPELLKEISAMKKLHRYSALTTIKRIGNTLLPEFLRQTLRGWAGKSTAAPDWVDLRKMKAKPVDPFTAAGFKASSLADFSISQLTSSNLPMLLHWEDRDSMAHSVESRVPYLDHRLVEYAISLPDSYKLKGGLTKRTLRSAMKGYMPDEIVNRIDKLGFITAEEYWLKEQATAEFRAALHDSIESSGGILNENLKTLFEDMVAGRKPFSHLIWRAICFGAWIREFKVQLPATQG
jgi:asparagine synthase (glutamine-hydrolysing)